MMTTKPQLVDLTDRASLQLLGPPGLSDPLSAGPSQAAERSLVTRTGPVGCVLFDLSSHGEKERDLRWAALAGDLARQEAPAAMIDALTAEVMHAHQAPETLAVFASSAGDILHRQRMDGTSLDNRADYGAPARVAPVLAWSQSRPPYVMAVVDRCGADVMVGVGGAHAPQSYSLDGPEQEIVRNAPLGWSQPRYRRHAELNWRRNAAAVAEAVTKSVSDVGAQVLVLAGDPRATQLLLGELPSTPVLLCHITGSRSADGSQHRRHHDLDQALQRAAEWQSQNILEQFRAHLTPGGRSVQGREATLQALAAGRVRCLLVGGTPGQDDRVWFADEALEIFPDLQSAVLAAKAPRAGSLVDVAIRSALMSGARVRILPPGADGTPADGIGAVQRG